MAVKLSFLDRSRQLFLDNFRKYRHFFLYCLIGCSGALLDYLIFLGLTDFLGMKEQYQWVNLLSVSTGILNNFWLNARFNFKKSDHLLKRFLSFYAVGMFGWLVSAGCLYVLIERMEIRSAIAKIVTIFVVTVLQFTLNKLITFGKIGKENV